MRVSLICIAWLSCCAAALAGPWPREQGTSFLSFSIESPTDGGKRDFYYSLYGEYGLTENLTLGFDGGSDYYTEGEGYVFLRVPIAFPGERHKFAVLGGLGARRTLTSFTEAVYVLGGSWGMSFDSALGPGWATVDATVRDRQTTNTRLTKVDTTLGVNRSSGQLWFAQLRFSDESRAPAQIWELAPSVVFKLGANAWLETSAVFGLRGGEDFKLKLGLWTEF